MWVYMKHPVFALLLHRGWLVCGSSHQDARSWLAQHQSDFVLGQGPQMKMMRTRLAHRHKVATEIRQKQRWLVSRTATSR
jgi:hypothetical protein